jgi:hypothetical protein
VTGRGYHPSSSPTIENDRVSFGGENPLGKSKKSFSDRCLLTPEVVSSDIDERSPDQEKKGFDCTTQGNPVLSGKNTVL